MKPVKPTKTVLVRCLGPGKEHKFQSRDRTNERVCKACREKLMSVSTMVINRPMRVSIEDQ